MKNFREIEQLSAYLDGQLKASEAARLESRLKSDPELASVLSDLRATRGILGKLPKRKAPRNFTLTRKMVGLKPPLPRTYPLFRLATVFSTFMLMLSFTVNAMSPYVSFSAPAPAYGFGGGGGDELSVGGGCEGPCPEEAAATEAPMLELEPPAAAEEGALPAPEPQMDTMQAPKEAGSESEYQNQAMAEEEAQRNAQPVEAPISMLWQIIFLVIGILSGGLMWFMRRSALKKWQ
ncbi:MAG: hypothetical protein FJ031_02095 [Chloroflexi bacterium]|nr:hypothetical protein [Chloroflexota bacterium]